MINELSNSKFNDVYYSRCGCVENIRRINEILKLKDGDNNE